jgi:hypothetical protein
MGFQPMLSNYHRRLAFPTPSTRPEAQRSLPLVLTPYRGRECLDAASGELGFLGWNVF